MGVLSRLWRAQTTRAHRHHGADAMLARLLHDCVTQVAMDGDEGSGMERLFTFVDAFCKELPSDARPTLDDAYRAFLWDTLLLDERIHVGVVKKVGPKKQASRQSILAKGREDALLATPEPVKPGPLDALIRQHGKDALRVYVDATSVRRILTGTDAPFVSAAAYTALQLVYRAREHGITVVELGAVTHYDQKTVYYLVKLLVERDLVVKFTARETGQVSNYVVARRFLEFNPQWRAQQNALGPNEGDVGEPSWIDVDSIAALREGDEKQADEGEEGLQDQDTSDTALTMPPVSDPHEGEMLAYPMLSDEQSAVWLHSRQDLLSERLMKLLSRSPSHMTPRRYLQTRLGLRPIASLRRAFLSFINQHVVAGRIERVRVKFQHTTPLYVRATGHGGEAGEFAAQDAPVVLTCSLRHDATIEWQLLAHIDACGSSGCTMQELAHVFGFSAEVKRMVEQILSRQVSHAPPYAPLAICAPFEQCGRERRIRYYSARGFKQRCEAEGLSMSTALGCEGASDGGAFVPNVPDVLPGECMCPSADAARTAQADIDAHVCGFFRNLGGPQPLRGTKRRAPVNPATGQRKRGRPRKGEERPKPEPEPKAEVPDEPPVDPRLAEPDPAWDAFRAAPVRAAESRTNMSAFHRAKLLTSVLEHAGGALDEVDISRRTREFLETNPSAIDVGDLSDRTTRAKTLAHAVQRKLVKLVKVPRADDGQRAHSIVHLASLTGRALHDAMEAALTTPETRGTVAHGDVAAEQAGLAAAQPRTAPWADSKPITFGAPDDPLGDASTQHAFARHAHLLRQYYGFAHGAAARLQVFLEAANEAQQEGKVSLSWFVTACPLRTFVTLVPVRLRTPAVVRAVTGAPVRVDQVSPHVATRLGLGRHSAHRQRLAVYATQLADLGLARPVGPDTWVLEEDAPVMQWPRQVTSHVSVRTPADRQAYWSAMREAVTHSDAKSVPMYLALPAWRDTFHLRGVQKAFLKRYAHAPPPLEGLKRLAAAIFAPVSAVTAYFSARTSSARGMDETLMHKVEARRQQRIEEWEAAVADVRALGPPQSGEPRTLLKLAAQYVDGREAVQPQTLRRKIATALGMHKKRLPAVAKNDGERRPRRSQSTAAWTPAHQDMLRDAYVILHERQRAWRALHAARGEAVADDWSALAQLVDESDSSLAALNTWRARRKQLAHAPHEQVRLALVERAWHALAERAREDGSLPDADYPNPSSLHLRAHIAFLRRHIDQAQLMHEHAEHAARTVLPYELTDDHLKGWMPIPSKALVPSEMAPMVHRLHAARMRPMTACEHDEAVRVTDDVLALTAVKMIVPTHVAADELAKWTDALGAPRVERALAALVSRRVLVQDGGSLAYSADAMRSMHGMPPTAPVREATEHAVEAKHVVAHPAASESETTAWLYMLERGQVRASLDMAPLHALRRRPKLNARTLDDAETECLVHMDVKDAQAPSVAMPAEPAPFYVTSRLADALERAGSDGLLACDVDDTDLSLTPGRGTSPAYCLGYDMPRLVLARHADPWRVPTLHSPVFPRAWLDLHGDVHLALWHERVALVQDDVARHPGTRVDALVARLASMLDRMEVYDILESCAAAGYCAMDVPFWRLRPAHVHPLRPGW